jgi:hypothetical protein
LGIKPGRTHRVNLLGIIREIKKGCDSKTPP